MNGIIGFFLTFITIVILSQSDASSFNKISRIASYRLPNNLYPEYYQLDIITNLGDVNENFTFSGRVGIKMICRYQTDKIILHSKNLDIIQSEVNVWGREFISDEDVPKLTACESDCPSEYYQAHILSQTFIPEYDFYVITLAEELKAGNYYFLNIPYKGELTQDLAGYYRSSYKDEQGIRWLGVTQFESTDARRALPCFDEPIFKSRFQVNLGHINTRKSISNMPLSSTYSIKQMENWVWDQYEVTPPMSVYLLAFVVFDSSFKEFSNKDGITSIYARKDAIEQVGYACHIAPRILKYFEQYFDIKYALPKLQMVAVPDFNSGGMENWGLITFRETALLYDPRVSTRSNQLYVASVVAHEIAHQWFGNLVTMKWWTDLWLNEGFATYISGFGVRHVTSEVNFLDEEIVDNALSVFAFDSSVTSHSISVPIGNPSEIAQIFDTISYKKGSFALRMLHSLLGEEAFRRGLSKYLKKYAYNNADQDDLWESLTEEAHHSNALPAKITIKKVMDSWTLQTGYPVVTVRRDYEKGVALVTQERFLIYPQYLKNSAAFNSTWWVPLSYTFANESDFNSTEPRTWIRNKREEIVILNLPENQWIIFNIRLSGIYRVNYDLKNWNLLISSLIDNHQSIGMLNRVQLIDDSFNLAKARRLKYDIALGMLQYLKNETEYFPWKTALRNLGFIDKILRYYPSYEQFRELISNLLKDIYEKTSRIKYFDTPENLYKIKLQELVANWACKYEIGDCKEKAVSWFYKWMNTSDSNEANPIPKNLRPHIYCTAVRAGGETEWDFLWVKYLLSNVGDEKSLILMSLTCTRDVRLLYRYLNWSLNETFGIRKQDSPSVFAGIARSEVGFFLAKNFLMNRLEDIYKYYGPNSTRIGNYISAVGSQITFQNDLSEFQNLINKNQHHLSQSQLVVDQALYNAAINVWLGKEVSSEFKEYFECSKGE